MNKLTLFFAIGLAFIVGVFWINTQEKMAKDRCMMAGGIWSEADGACDN